MLRERDIRFPSIIYDRLYGEIPFTTDDIRLFQTPQLTRLRSVSLSAIPPWTIPVGVCASKFEHSIGVAHLARIVTKCPEFRDIEQDLFFAALVHDLATPPFSHASERFLVLLTGKDHEEFIEDVIGNSNLVEEIKRQGGSIDRVIRFVTGKDKPLSDLVNGSIDLDNLDNTLRYGLSIGLFRNQPYSPERLARSFAMRNGELVFVIDNRSDLEGWEQCRKNAYRYIYGPENLCAGMMLFRALDFAFKLGELRRDYFFMTDAQAFEYLEQHCNPRTRMLMERLKYWVFYPRVFNFSSVVGRKQSHSVKDLSEIKMRSEIADELADTLKIPPEDIAVFTGKDKGFKRIHLQIINRHGNGEEHIPASQLMFMVQVYVHPKWVDKVEEIKDFMKYKLRIE